MEEESGLTLEVAGLGVWGLWARLGGGGNRMGSGTRSRFGGRKISWNLIELTVVQFCACINTKSH